MEQKLINMLIKDYQNRGIDLYALVDDPLFIQLPLEKKVALIKHYAATLSAGTRRTITKSDVRAVITDALLAGIGGGAAGLGGAIAAASHFSGGTKLFKGGKLPWGSLAIAAAVSGGAMAAGTALHASKILKNRTEVAHRLDAVAKDPTEENAIKVLMTRNKQVSPNGNLSAPSTAGRMIGNMLSQIPVKIMAESAPTHVIARTFMHNLKSGVPVNPQYTEDQVIDLALEAHAKAFDPKQFFK